MVRRSALVLIDKIIQIDVQGARQLDHGSEILRANGAANIGRELYVNALNPLHAMAYRAT